MSPFAKPGNSGRSCSRARYSTIQAGVEAAPAWGLVEVCRGTYVEDVVVTKPLSLRGHRAVISGSPTANAMCDQLGASGPGSAPCLAGLTIKSSHVHVEGFTVQNAIGEGILATGSLAGGSISDVKVLRNKVVGNNTGGIPPTPSSPYPQCSAFGEVPGDCGEGIHLMGVGTPWWPATTSAATRAASCSPTSSVRRTTTTSRATSSPATPSTAASPCRATTRSPSTPAASASRGGRRVPQRHPPQPGHLQRPPGRGRRRAVRQRRPGTGSYDNLVEDNYLAGNELAGVTMHAHTIAPGQFEDLSGNKIVDNVIGAEQRRQPGRRSR